MSTITLANLHESEGFLTRAEMAQLFGVEESVIRGWEKTQNLPVIKRGRARFYSRRAVVAWLEKSAA